MLYMAKGVEGGYEVELLDANGFVIFSSLVDGFEQLTKVKIHDLTGHAHIVRVLNLFGDDVARQFVQFSKEQHKYCTDPVYEKL